MLWFIKEKGKKGSDSDFKYLGKRFLSPKNSLQYKKKKQQEEEEEATSLGDHFQSEFILLKGVHVLNREEMKCGRA